VQEDYDDDDDDDDDDVCIKAHLESEPQTRSTRETDVEEVQNKKITENTYQTRRTTGENTKSASIDRRTHGATMLIM